MKCAKNSADQLVAVKAWREQFEIMGYDAVKRGAEAFKRWHSNVSNPRICFIGRALSEEQRLKLGDAVGVNSRVVETLGLPGYNPPRFSVWRAFDAEDKTFKEAVFEWLAEKEAEAVKATLKARRPRKPVKKKEVVPA